MDTKHMLTNEDNPGAPMPPPLSFALTFLVGYVVQMYITINNIFFQALILKIMAGLLIAISFVISFLSMTQFRKSKNTVISVKPATSLQTSGIYKLTRNPMYVGLSALYLSLSILFGNWWHFILFPFLCLLIQEYNIKREEKYLERTFGQDYINYKKKVRRWL